MELIEYFEFRAAQILSSTDYDQAVDYFGFFFGAYDLSNQLDLFSTIEDKKAIEEIYNQLKVFMEDLAAYNMRVTID